MADIMLNIATSAVLGAGLTTAPAFIRDKWKNRHPAKALDLVLDELDTATHQMSLGQKVDVAAGEKIVDGSIAKMDMKTKAGRVEAEIRGGRSPIIENVAEIRAAQKENKISSDVILAKPLPQAEVAPLIQEGLSPKTLRELETPASYIVRDKVTGRVEMETSNQKVIAKLNNEKYEAVPIIEHLANLNGQTYYQGDAPLQKAAIVRETAFGGRSLDEVAAQIDADNTKAVSKAVIAANDPNNDTAIDYDAIAALNERDAKIEEQINFEEEIAAMREQGLLTEEDEMALDALSEYNPKDSIAAYEAAYICLTRG